MKKIVIVFGLLSGLIQLALSAITLPMILSGRLDHGYLIGYSSMVLSLLMVFFGIRSYRENVGGGAVTFGKAFQVGILISLITCVMYVTAWEIYFFNFDPGFADHYAASVVQKLEKSGASPAEIAAEKEKMAQFKAMYAKPLFNIGMTFLEIFPVALVMTLVSAAILRKKPGAPPRAPATVTA